MAPSDIVVAPVHSKSDLAAFIELPNRLYAGHRGYVAPLAVERREALSAKKNPIFQHLEARFFLARRSDFSSPSSVVATSVVVSRRWIAGTGVRSASPRATSTPASRSAATRAPMTSDSRTEGSIAYERHRRMRGT